MGYERSGGPTVDALELKLSGSTPLEEDLHRAQEVEVTFRGVVTSHGYKDKRKDGEIIATVKTITVSADELVEMRSLVVPRKMPGQPAIGDNGEVVDENGPVGDAGRVTGKMVDTVAAIAGIAPEGGTPQFTAGGRSATITVPGILKWPDDGVDPETGEVVQPPPDHPDEDQPEVPSEDGPEPPERHPQIPEDAWGQLNILQRHEVLDHVAAMETLAEAHAQASTPTDAGTYSMKLARRARDLADDYGIELMEPETLPEVPPEEPPPPPIGADSPPTGRATLLARRTYLESRTALPAEAIAARSEELEVIRTRLEALNANERTG